MKTGYRWLSLVLSEFLGTFILAHLFAYVALYNRGIETVFVDDPSDDDDEGYYSIAEHGILSPWVQAFVTAGGLFVLYLIGSRFAKRHLHLNPIVSAFVITSDTFRGYYANWWAPLGQLVILWLAQALGSFAGAAAVWGYVGPRIQDAAIYLGDDLTLTTGVINRAWISELLYGTLLLILLTLWLRPMTYDEDSKKSTAKCDYGLWAAGLGAFYFFYMALFWVYSKATIDFIREGAYCVFAGLQSNQDGGVTHVCSPGVYSGSAGLYLFFLTIQGLVSLLAVIIAVIYAAMSSKNGYTRVAAKMR